MCMYVAHWTIFMVNKHDLQQQQKNRQLNISLALHTPLELLLNIKVPCDLN